MKTVSLTFLAVTLLFLAVSCQTPVPEALVSPPLVVHEPAPIDTNESILPLKPESSLETPIVIEEPVVKPIEPVEPVQIVEIEDEAPVEEPIIEPETIQEPVRESFNPLSITKEIFDSTKIDVQELISRLNGIIREKKFDEWILFLGTEYRQILSEPGFLARISSSAVLRKQGITLHDIRDYFMYVVVPSRAKDRVDDIEFIGQNRVKAFTIDTKGRKLRLYDLEKTTSGWKIVD